MNYTVDLHTHSYASPDGGLSLAQYRYFLDNNLLDFIAITDHNMVEAALDIKAKLGKTGERIIVGQEVMTDSGEIIGLYLQKHVEQGMSPLETAKAIHDQKGLVYIPHPFETTRSGLQAPTLNVIANEVDIVETCNGRAIFQNRRGTALLWARQNAKPGAASSDAHGRFGWGYTYSRIKEVPNQENLCQLLNDATYSTRAVGWGILYPKLNRLRKGLLHGAV